MKYAVIDIYDSVSNSSSTLNNLLNNYVVGLYMTVPIVDMQSRSFKYSVQQIRGYLETTTNVFTYNLTLSKQEMTFADANYTINRSPKTISTYNFLNYPSNAHQYTQTSTSKTYTITLSYNSIVDSYVVQ
jgi:hypothetical protein